MQWMLGDFSLSPKRKVLVCISIFTGVQCNQIKPIASAVEAETFYTSSESTTSTFRYNQLKLVKLCHNLDD